MRLEDMSIEQLLEMNQIICERIDELRAKQDMQAIMKLRLGAKVHFNTPDGKVFGTLIKVNRKTVVVVSEDRRQWKVSPGLVKLVEDVS
ncbi:transposase [Thiosulfativibrio zosterae]|uniref:Uncharacterized protein n=1 Tax=Thiosulfativibrio zosterae TaxID=2675053 RepID=A0A6F8PLW1_9GAMM|nr:transposase [Thiosulfativibrio zosterae]BBP43101.1 hypothetical protein THMIRHAT_08470 [Thiosulfativibrio zosterae]